MFSDNSISALAAMTGGYSGEEVIHDEDGAVVPELDPDSLRQKREIDVQSFLEDIITDAVRMVDGGEEVMKKDGEEDGEEEEEEEPTGDGEGKKKMEVATVVTTGSSSKDNEKPQREQDMKEQQPAEKVCMTQGLCLVSWPVYLESMPTINTIYACVMRNTTNGP